MSPYTPTNLLIHARQVLICLLTVLFLSAGMVSAFAADDEPKPKPEPQPEKAATGKPDGEKKEEDAKEDEKKKEKKDDGEKSFRDITKKCDRIEGLFDLYQDEKDGTVYLAVKPNQLDREFIYFSQTRNGVVETGHFRGDYADARVFTIRKNFDRLEFAMENTSFYFDPDNALSRAADANISPALLASQEIVATHPKRGTFLIKADDLFLKEIFRLIKWPEDPDDKGKNKDRLKLGELSGDKTKFTEIHNYPENTVLVVEYVFDNPRPQAWGEADVTDARYISIKTQHTLIEMPENTYQPRYDDPRVGYFLTKVTDMTSTSTTPYRDVIHRWNLKKKDPTAEISEPVEPIRWWIENTTPMELRDTIKSAALLWNQSFEKAGFRNALTVEIQPDDADWDAGDIRYNVLRWTSSPDPPFGGYGPSFVNPRTGEILGADIMLEYLFITNRVRMSQLLKNPAARNAAKAVLPERAGHQDHVLCNLGPCLHESNMFGSLALKSLGASPLEIDEMLKDSLHYLVLHELGHTLGLSHNFRASQMTAFADIHNEELTRKKGLTGSVMDYPSVNISPEHESQGQFYSDQPGPYDDWAIEYGYSQGLNDPKAEQERLEAILARSTEPALAFANDADDMRSPGKAIDPRAMIGDMSSDAIAYAEERCGLMRRILPELSKRLLEPGESHQDLRVGWTILMAQYEDAMDATSRYIGGVYVDRALVGQPGGGQPFKPVPAEDQKRAMKALDTYLFGPDAWQFPPELLAQMQLQRRGWDFYESKGEDPKIHEEVLTLQKNVLSHLLHQNTQQRIIDSELYGNAYTVADEFEALYNAIMQGEKVDRINTFRQNLQVAFVEKLIQISGLKNDSSYPTPSKSLALHYLTVIQSQFAQFNSTDTLTRAHAEYVVHLIDEAMDKE